MKIALTIFIIVWCMVPAPCQVIPAPNQYISGEGKLLVPKKIRIHTTDTAFAALIPVIQQMGKQYFRQSISGKKRKPFVTLVRNTTITGKEHYRLKITTAGITIEAAHVNGCFYGLQTLLQLVHSAGKKRRLDCAIINDQPRYAWRGLMLDESRHFYGMDAVKQILDFMAIHKMNVFHWHLTDVPGWRLEIKQYPLLTSIGGKGNETNRNAPAQFYTQHQVKEIVAYARQRQVAIIPEIDMPGHATAAVKAYPQFGGGGAKQNPDFTFNPGLDSTYSFLTDIIREVDTLLSPAYIHIGGDEVHFGNQQWPNLPAVQQLMQLHKLENMVQVEHYFLRRMADSIRIMGRKVAAWDEVVPAGLHNQHTLVMWWRHNRPQVLKDALQKGYEVVLCPRLPLYFDFVQHSTHTYGRKWDSLYVPLQNVYEFPLPKYLGGVDANHPRIVGIQANLWTPTMHNVQRLQFMLYPRLSALAEAAWTNDGRKDLKDFKDRLNVMLNIYEQQRIRYFDHRQQDPIEEIGPGPAPIIVD